VNKKRKNNSLGNNVKGAELVTENSFDENVFLRVEWFRNTDLKLRKYIMALSYKLGQKRR
jgi:hypothetical protein